MENLAEKRKFLKDEYTLMLSALDPDAKGVWGKMNALQMIEHMAEYVRMGSGAVPVTIVTPEEHLPRMQAFLVSDKPFRENTPNSLMPETPPEARHRNITEATEDLQQEIDRLFEAFEATPGMEVANPFFGILDFDMTIQLLHKHAWHHLRQFGIAE